MTFKQKISIQIGLFTICMFLLIPTANHETILNFIIPTLRIVSRTGSGVFFVNYNLALIIIAIFSFFRLRDNLKQINSQWRYVLYIVVFIWLSTNINTEVGEKVMSFRKGLNVVEFKTDKSELEFNKDSLGIIHAEGNLTFRNYGSDTIVFKGVLQGKDINLMYGDELADITFPDMNSSNKEKYIKISPKSTYSYPVKFDSKLKVCNSAQSNYNGTVNRITRFTIYSDNERKTFED